MRSVFTVATRPDLTVSTVTCRDDHRGWSEAEERESYGVVLVRHGRFRRRSGGVDADVDRSVGYVSLPGQEEYFAHPAGGDLCTSISLSPELWRQSAGHGLRPAGATLYIDARTDLAHRRLLLAAQAGDVDYALTEELLRLLASALVQLGDGTRPSATRNGELDRNLVDEAREAIGSGHPGSHGLLPLARLLSVSPYRLSRAFSRSLGVSLTQYRNRVRVGRVLDRLEHGESSLARLAADLGFSDQAHLCRTVRQHVGHTPSTLRFLLAS